MVQRLWRSLLLVLISSQKKVFKQKYKVKNNSGATTEGEGKYMKLC